MNSCANVVQLLSSLREVKSAFTGEMLDTGNQYVRTALMSQPGGAAIARKLDVAGRCDRHIYSYSHSANIQQGTASV